HGTLVGTDPDDFMTLVHLSKLHATGNDFLVALDDELKVAPETAQALCDRHRGIGADGLIVIGPGRDGADCTMTLSNADGGIAEMSGNGIRCLAYVAARAGLGSRDELVVDTGGGRRVVRMVRADDGAVTAADVDMGAVELGPRDVPVIVRGVTYVGDDASVGNPHFVCFVEDPLAVPVSEHGAEIERDARFPVGVNVEFIAVDARDALTMRVWERGVGETLSCGTGACAAAAVAHDRGLVDDHVRVLVPGGELTVALGATVRLGGPVMHVFDVEVEI
ncbi:MAG TPA: diaminopimelate epimerase, partial [Acidimicrobiia bacterium]|nr:diaminopimelate epimerase [Acidimicrobiia bacterium]